jgi:hypothetical protein
LQSLLLKIDVTEIIVHKTHQPNTVVDLLDACRLPCERSAEIYFLFEDANLPLEVYCPGCLRWLIEPSGILTCSEIAEKMQ